MPITLGTYTLEAIDEHLVTNNLVQNLETEWRLVHQAILYRQSLTKDHILGLVRATKNIIIQPFSCVNISGLVRTQKGGFSLHVVAEPSIQAKLPEGISLAGEQYLDITQGSSRVGLIFENQTEKPITIKERTILCQLVIGNLVPKLVAPKYDISELDRHFLEEEILTELDEEGGYSPDHQMSQWIIMSSKRLLRIFPQPLLTVVKSQHKCPLCLVLLQKRKRHLLKTTLMRMAVGFLIKLMFLVQKNFGEDYYQKAKALFIKYQNTFSRTDMDLGRAANVKHHIILTDPIPFKERYRRIPPQLYDEVRNHLQEMLRLGAIRRSCSPWASAIVLVRKKNGKLRFCIDLRKLNSKTLKDSYALPRIEQTLESLADSMVYSTLDLTSGYWQVEMAEECKPYTAFTCGPLGFFECETMPFGATNAPATFQRLMEDCL